MVPSAIGLYFGSFNPIHIGHLIIANAVLDEAKLKEIWFVVSPQNPHKRDSKSLAHEFDRLDMIDKAIGDDYRFRSCDIEFHLPKPNYTVHSLAFLSEKHPSKKFILIIGEDNLASFKKWKNYKVILEQYGLLVYPRKDSGISDLLDHKNVTKIDAPLIDLSASYIRRCIKKGKSIKYLVPDNAIDMIKRRGLYR